MRPDFTPGEFASPMIETPMNQPTQDEFAEQFLRSQRRIYAYIVSMLPNRADAEEVFQQTSLILWRKWAEFDREREFDRWACGIAHHEVRNYIRRAGRGSVSLTDAMLDTLGENLLSGKPRQNDRFDALEKCLQELSASHQELVERCYCRDEKPIELAEQLGIAPATLYMKLHRIRRALVECVERRQAAEDAS
jgi:RNA polymerase sigma-70 factor (ECF subfamily)